MHVLVTFFFFLSKTFVLYYHNCYFQEKSCSGISGHLTVQMCCESSTCIPAASVCRMCFYLLILVCSALSDVICLVELLQGRTLGRQARKASYNCCCLKPFVGDSRSQSFWVTPKPPQPFPEAFQVMGRTLHHCQLH